MSTEVDYEQLHKDLSRFDFTEEDLIKGLGDPMWRLNHLYKIVDADKKVITFKLNEAQKLLVQNMHTRNIILKARKMGFSTFIEVLAIDTALFSPHERCVIIAQDLSTSEAIFRDVIKFAYEQLPEIFKTAAPTEGEPSKSKIEFTNGSIIEVRTSARGGTPSFLHVSEMGIIAAKDPHKAQEIVEGAIAAVPQNGMVFIESTAESGEEGLFFNMCQSAVRLQDSGRKLSKLNFKFHFYGWWRDNRYRLADSSVVISPREHEYFDNLELEIGRPIDQEQRNWYVDYRDSTFGGEVQPMNSQFPSTWMEAFRVSMEGAYFTEQFRALRKKDQLTDVPYDPMYPVSSFWDIGGSDQTAIWLIQAKPGGYAVINYTEAVGEPFNYFIRWMQDLNYVWNTHYLPHDSKQTRQQGMRVTTAEEMIMELAPNWNFYVVPKTPDKMIPIQQARNILPTCTFDVTNCKVGIRHLEAYRKEYDSRLGRWKSTPRHGPESNAADAFLQFCQAVTSGAFGEVISAYAVDSNGFSGGYVAPPILDY